MNLAWCSTLFLIAFQVSVSCGIPDFRSRDGIYAKLSVEYPDLPDPQAMFDIAYFYQNPRPFFKFAKVTRASNLFLLKGNKHVFCSCKWWERIGVVMLLRSHPQIKIWISLNQIITKWRTESSSICHKNYKLLCWIWGLLLDLIVFIFKFWMGNNCTCTTATGNVLLKHGTVYFLSCLSCDLCDADYMSGTQRNTLQKNLAIGRHFLEAYGSNVNLLKESQFRILRKCQGKFDCLVFHWESHA